jgi:hypothetical protein
MRGGARRWIGHGALRFLVQLFFLLFGGEVAPGAARAIYFLSYKQTSPKRISFPPFFFFYIVPLAGVTKKGSTVTDVGPKGQDR